MTALTLAQRIEASAVSFDQLHKNYRPLLLMVQELIGVVPNCDPILEIWSPGFRTYNLLVPNLLNLPLALAGHGAPKDLVGLAMYVASRSSGCMYCSAHTCSFALRRGASPEAITGTYSEAEALVAEFAEAITDGSLCAEQVLALGDHLSSNDIEWVVMSVAMMGFLNKFMDTMGIELEESSIDDVEDLISQTGWHVGKHSWSEEIDEPLEGKPLRTHSPTSASSQTLDENTIDIEQTEQNEPAEPTPGYLQVPTDSLGTLIRVAKQTPGALRLERQWTKGFSNRKGASLLQLENEVGYSFPILSSMRHGRVVKALAAALRENLDPENTEVGLDAKCMAGLVYASVIDNDMLLAESVQLLQLLAPEIDLNLLSAVAKFASTDSEVAVLPPGLSAVHAAVIMLAKVAAPNPSEVNEITIELVADVLTPAQIVEVVVWLSLQQTLQRLYVFYEVLRRLSEEIT